ncbi:MAG: hypothetical protein EAZ42_03770 [Verrucomicrobia bacterium]|nr:MAG: hypothetical protein EAZ42_03770 [Verrucomicrobiota bacterium]
MKTKPSRGITLQQKPHFRTKSASKQPKGFALIVTLTLMILLTVIAVGLLSLSSITLRTSSQSQSLAEARANARLAVMLALSALQSEAGDDRRITADAGILDSNTAPKAIGEEINAQYAVAGVWDSWSPEVGKSPMNKTVEDYATEKNNRFRRWLVSTKNPNDAKNSNWYRTPVPNAVQSGAGVKDNWPQLFTSKRNGQASGQPTNHFAINAEPIHLTDKANVIQGRLAYAVIQENTKAKINIGGPDQLTHPNDVLMAQPRPSLANTPGMKQPNAGFNLMASRVLSLSQLRIEDPVIEAFRGDQSFPQDPNIYRYDLTTDSRGLLTDVVNGGLKVDLSLAFEMPSSQFAQDVWNDFDNPFRSSDNPSYQGQVPLYTPMAEDGNTTVSVLYSRQPRDVNFPGSAAATFDTLRSHYRSAFHLYGGDGSPTAFTRLGVHPAVSEGYNDLKAGPGNANRPLQPVLDRLVMTMSVQINADGKFCLVINPVVVIWNPYNVAVESPGLVVYPLLDFPFGHEGWAIVRKGTGESGVAGRNKTFRPGGGTLTHFFNAKPGMIEGRSDWPYFYLYLSSNGNKSNPAPIRLAPGELKAFQLRSPGLQAFQRIPSILERTFDMIPIADSSDLRFNSGIAVKMHLADSITGVDGFDGTAAHQGGPYIFKELDTFSGAIRYSAGKFESFIVMEDGRNFSFSDPVNRNRNVISEMHFSSPRDKEWGQGRTQPSTKGGIDSSSAVRLSTTESIPLAKITYYRRTAKAGTSNLPAGTPIFQTGDLLFTTNPRSAFTNPILSNFDKATSGPQYDLVLEPYFSNIDAPLSLDRNGNAYSGVNHSAGQGKTSLPFFEVPQTPLLSLAGFQHLDISTSAFSTAFQIGNSWAMPYMSRSIAMKKIEAGHSIRLDSIRDVDKITLTTDFPVVDFSYLANEALWDKYFFSGVASDVSPSATGGKNSWNDENGRINKPYTNVLQDFMNDPSEFPLRNSSMVLHTGGKSNDALLNELSQPEGCLKIAGNLMLDGAFNVNSMSVGAWTALLSGLQDANFTVDNGGPPRKGLSYFSRMSRPRNEANDNWEGYRGLTSAEVNTLALEIVKQVQKRGPFLSLGEFVNRQLSGAEEGLAGAIQAAIGKARINSNVNYQEIDETIYSEEGRNNLVAPDKDTGVSIPGYLTQADVLNSIGPRLTARSDTFTIRGYGESFDAATNRIKAKVVIEAVVQRVPEFVDSLDPAYTPILGLKSTVNRIFGRRFEIVSYRELAPEEL